MFEDEHEDAHIYAERAGFSGLSEWARYLIRREIKKMQRKKRHPK